MSKVKVDGVKYDTNAKYKGANNSTWVIVSNESEGSGFELLEVNSGQKLGISAVKYLKKIENIESELTCEDYKNIVKLIVTYNKDPKLTFDKKFLKIFDDIELIYIDEGDNFSLKTKVK